MSFGLKRCKLFAALSSQSPGLLFCFPYIMELAFRGKSRSKLLTFCLISILQKGSCLAINKLLRWGFAFPLTNHRLPLSLFSLSPTLHLGHSLGLLVMQLFLWDVEKSQLTLSIPEREGKHEADVCPGSQNSFNGSSEPRFMRNATWRDMTTSIVYRNSSSKGIRKISSAHRTRCLVSQTSCTTYPCQKALGAMTD